MFFILREPADSLATAVITYRNEDRLTLKDQLLCEKPSTSRQWMLNSNDPLYTSEGFLKHRPHLPQ